MKRTLMAILLVIAVVFLISFPSFAQGSKTIQLMKPQTDGGKPLMQVLSDRKSSRAFEPTKLPPQVLSNLLWAAFGINRSQTGQRTAPSAMNRQEIDVYVATPDGLYLYDAAANALKEIHSQDIRELTGRQAFAQQVPLNLVYVADMSKAGNGSREEQEFYAAADTGFISENVYLFCASEGLATVVRASIDREALAKAMKLRPEQKIILAQSIGYPKP